MQGRAEMFAGVVKAIPFAAVLGALRAKDALAYAGIVSMLSAILVVGALWGAAKAWRERAEARADEADQLEKQALVTEAQIEDLRHELDTVKADLKARPDLRENRAADAEEHRAIISSIDRQNGALTAALERNTTALETLARNVPWAEIVDRRPA